MNNTPSFREMGRIVRPHGVMGELKVAPETDDPSRFQVLKSIYVGSSEDTTTSFDILSVRLQPSKYGVTVVLQLEGVNSREEAEKLNKLRVFALSDDLPPLEEGEYYLSDLLGMEVVEQNDDTVIGTVRDVIERPGQNLLLVQRSGKPDVMVPLVDAFVGEIDFGANRILVSPIEGLLD